MRSLVLFIAIAFSLTAFADVSVLAVWGTNKDFLGIQGSQDAHYQAASLYQRLNSGGDSVNNLPGVSMG